MYTFSATNYHQKWLKLSEEQTIKDKVKEHLHQHKSTPLQSGWRYGPTKKSGNQEFSGAKINVELEMEDRNCSGTNQGLDSKGLRTFWPENRFSSESSIKQRVGWSGPGPEISVEYESNLKSESLSLIRMENPDKKVVEPGKIGSEDWDTWDVRWSILHYFWIKFITFWNIVINLNFFYCLFFLQFTITCFSLTIPYFSRSLFLIKCITSKNQVSLCCFFFFSPFHRQNLFRKVFLPFFLFSNFSVFFSVWECMPVTLELFRVIKNETPSIK